MRCLYLLGCSCFKMTSFFADRFDSVLVSHHGAALSRLSSVLGQHQPSSAVPPSAEIPVDVGCSKGSRQVLAATNFVACIEPQVSCQPHLLRQSFKEGKLLTFIISCVLFSPLNACNLLILGRSLCDWSCETGGFRPTAIRSGARDDSPLAVSS